MNDSGATYFVTMQALHDATKSAIEEYGQMKVNK